MTTSSSKTEPSHLLLACAALAFLSEVTILFLLGIKFPNIAIPHAITPETLPTEVLLVPEEHPKLIAENAAPLPKEETLSKKTAKKNSENTQKHTALEPPPANQVQSGKPISPTHGPILIESPAPLIPEYLKSNDLNTKVVIEFTILKDGQVNPRLIMSSGNEELDQIAIKTAAHWKFYPAENNHQAINAKVRLKILFEVK